jgi:hypothetical protein
MAKSILMVLLNKNIVVSTINQRMILFAHAIIPNTSMAKSTDVKAHPNEHGINAKVLTCTVA